MSDIAPTSEVTYEDVLDGTSVYDDVGNGSEVDYLEYDGDGDFHAQGKISFVEELDYQTERSYGESFGWAEHLIKAVAAQETQTLTLSGVAQLGLFGADALAMTTVGKVEAGFGNGGFGQLGFGGLSNVAG